MNRQYKRLMKKQEAQKQKAPTRSPRPTAGAGAPKERTSPRQFLKEVYQELRKVHWPTTQETISYSIVVLVSSVVIAALIFAMDYVFTKAVLALYGVDV